MPQSAVRCLILACGNTLRSDDGVGPALAEWADEHFRENPAVLVISRQQWTPELAEDVAHAGSVLFIDCSIESAPGSLKLRPVAAATGTEALATHHVGAPELLSLGHELYNSLPSRAQLLTIGAGSIELGESFTDAVNAAIPKAQQLIAENLRNWLND